VPTSLLSSSALVQASSPTNPWSFRRSPSCPLPGTRRAHPAALSPERRLLGPRLQCIHAYGWRRGFALLYLSFLLAHHCWQWCFSTSPLHWIHHCIHHFLSLYLHDVLVSPTLIKNLVSICKLTCDNLVSVEFDPLGFSIKVLRNKEVLLRSESTGDLYPLSSALPIHHGLQVTVDAWHAVSAFGPLSGFW